MPQTEPRRRSLLRPGHADPARGGPTSASTTWPRAPGRAGAVAARPDGAGRPVRWPPGGTRAAPSPAVNPAFRTARGRTRGAARARNTAVRIPRCATQAGLPLRCEVRADDPSLNSAQGHQSTMSTARGGHHHEEVDGEEHAARRGAGVPQPVERDGACEPDAGRDAPNRAVAIGLAREAQAQSGHCREERMRERARSRRAA